MDWLIRIVLSYLVGSLNGSLLLGRLRGVDIRALGSGNAGGTNALRTQGPLFAIGAVFIDIAKGWLAAAWIPTLALPLGAAGLPPITNVWLPAACAFAAVLGHVYPVFHGFRGGKGGATVVGALLALSPVALVMILGAWLATVMVLGFVSLGTMVSAGVLPLALLAAQAQPQGPLLLFGLAAAVLVIYAHRSNIRRLKAGTEPRSKRLWLLGRPRP
jgi:glycerol-3-phosphate acyltransferase PlsY